MNDWVEARLNELHQRVDEQDVPSAVESAREELADEYADQA